MHSNIEGTFNFVWFLLFCHSGLLSSIPEFHKPMNLVFEGPLFFVLDFSQLKNCTQQNFEQRVYVSRVRRGRDSLSAALWSSAKLCVQHVQMRLSLSKIFH